MGWQSGTNLVWDQLSAKLYLLRDKTSSFLPFSSSHYFCQLGLPYLSWPENMHPLTVSALLVLVSFGLPYHKSIFLHVSILGRLCGGLNRRQAPLRFVLPGRSDLQSGQSDGSAPQCPAPTKRVGRAGCDSDADCPSGGVCLAKCRGESNCPCCASKASGPARRGGRGHFHFDWLSFDHL